MKRSPSAHGQGAQRGYTVVELMMALAVLTIGLGGVIAMQKVTVVANWNAKNLAIATHIAQSWLDEIQADSAQWNGTNDFNETDWLVNVGGEDTPAAAWFRPVYSETRKFGAGFDALGSPVTTQELATRAHFCSDLRLTWLGSQTGMKQGAGLVRVEARVYWLRDGITGLADSVPTSVCALTPQEMDDPANQALFHIIYLSTAVREHVGAE